MSKFDSLQKDWNDLAEIDPLWAIASVSGKEHGKWDITEFFETGKSRVNTFLTIIHDSGVELFPGVALDFGCGVGRLTQALTEVVDICYGIDISPEMIRLARFYNRFGEKCKYVLNQKNDLGIFDSYFFDLIISDIVLQHMPPDLMKVYLNEFIRVLKPMGILVFQIPIESTVLDLKTTHLKSLPKFHPQRIVNKLRGMLIGHGATDRYYRLRRLGLPKKWLYDKLGFRPNIEMHCLPEMEVQDIVASSGARIVRVVKQLDPGVISGIFVVQKC